MQLMRALSEVRYAGGERGSLHVEEASEESHLLGHGNRLICLPFQEGHVLLHYEEENGASKEEEKEEEERHVPLRERKEDCSSIRRSSSFHPSLYCNTINLMY